MLGRCLAIHKKVSLSPEDVQVSLMRELGVCLRGAGRLEEAERLLRYSLAIQKSKLGARDENVATTHAAPTGCMLSKGLMAWGGRGGVVDMHGNRRGRVEATRPAGGLQATTG